MYYYYANFSLIQNALLIELFIIYNNFFLLNIFINIWSMINHIGTVNGVQLNIWY